MAEPTKDQVLTIANGLPVKNLIKFVEKGVITISDLERAQLTDSKVAAIREAFKENEKKLWIQACERGTAKDFFDYLKIYPTGQYAEACRNALDDGEADFWQEVIAAETPEMFQQYLDVYEILDGAHVDVCREMLDDPMWLQLQKNPTLTSIEVYESQNPGKHTSELAQMREEIQDEIDWNNAKNGLTSDAYRIYIEAHPVGKHVAEANAAIAASAGRDAFIELMSKDEAPVSDIHMNVENHMIMWSDVEQIYGAARSSAIRSWKPKMPIPDQEMPSSLCGDSVEFYMWGTPSSGKTCALGSLISGGRSYYGLEPQECQGFNYMIRLGNVFRSGQLCSLPPSTAVNSLWEMMFTIKDEQGKLHKATLIDLAGELFRTLYFDIAKMYIDDERAATLELVKGLLADKRNPKVHFFVVEYGAENNYWEELSMLDYLDACSLFIRNNNILKNSVGVYILVTKCDKMGVPDDKVYEEAGQYVQNFLPSFYTNLKSACEKAGIKDFQVLPFSIGEVFAKELCIYDDSYIDDVYDVILTKTPVAKGGWLRK